MWTLVRRHARSIISGAVLVVLAVMLLAQLGGRPSPSPAARPGEPPPVARAPWWDWDPAPRARPTAKAVAPWDSTPENTPDPGPGYLAAWRVKPPRADGAPPSPPREPPNPQLTRAPLSNPGGVDGVLPPRPVPGLPPR